VPQKTARIEAEECPHLKVIDQNKEIFKKVLEKLADYSGNEPIICDSVRDLTVGFNGINEILGVLLAERLFPGSSPDPVVIAAQPALHRKPPLLNTPSLSSLLNKSR
jgi:hypothetical protein